MDEPKSKSLDIFGVKPVADAVSHASKAAIDGASAFLSRICLPVAEEFGLLLQDKVRVWRANNALRVVASAQTHLAHYSHAQNSHAHPRLVATVIEEGSWADDGMIQDIWGGLLASSCTEDGCDDSNLIFVGLLKQMTGLQIRVLRYACENCDKAIDTNGLITLKKALKTSAPNLLRVSGTNDIHRLDQELDHLRGLELLHGGFHPNMAEVEITPSALALNLYVRCQGYCGSAVEYFAVSA